MAGPVMKQRGPVEVEFFGFCLQEGDTAAVPVQFPEGWDTEGGFLTTCEGRLDVRSAGHTHTADLVVEVWDQPPPADVAGAWEADAQAVIVSPSGTLDVWGVTGGDAGEPVLLGRPGVWRLRLRCAGRAAVAKQSQHGVPEGVERYLAQFWPVRE
ncbi:hypothetical protein AB0467_28630 [Streptomyces sp. NPDC052095]|uniref:hypothetical protein n=1 Tax=unclassified Streptomyces TaxID=2593676 RepID=UPI00344F7620